MKIVQEQPTCNGLLKVRILEEPVKVWLQDRRRVPFAKELQNVIWVELADGVKYNIAFFINESLRKKALHEIQQGIAENRDVLLELKYFGQRYAAPVTDEEAAKIIQEFGITMQDLVEQAVKYMRKHYKYTDEDIWNTDAFEVLRKKSLTEEDLKILALTVRIPTALHKRGLTRLQVFKLVHYEATHILPA